jgi:hypothetical protein
MDQPITDSKSADVSLSSSNNGESASPVKRAIEVGFPIVEINRLAVPERNSFKPIYQIHKWFARRASCVFRAILLGALKPAVQPDGTPTDLMAEFYKDHSDDPDTKDKVILDPFMGGGTTVVEALRLRCRVIGIDLNPVAWFIVKTEIEPVDLDALKAAFERLAERPVAWNNGRSLKKTLLNLYKTEVADGIEADVIYTFWVKSAICTDSNCRREVPLFPNYIIAQKSPSIRYHRDAVCPGCRKTFDWEVQFASLIAEPSLMVNAPRGSGGEGRPTTIWSYAPEPPKPRKRGDLWPTDVLCPYCQQSVRMRVPSAKKKGKRSHLLCCCVRRVRLFGSGAVRCRREKLPVRVAGTTTIRAKAMCLRKESSNVLAARKMKSLRVSALCLTTSDCLSGLMRFRLTLVEAKNSKMTTIRARFLTVSQSIPLLKAV